MPVRQFKELAALHKGEDVWVIAAGPSAGYIAPEFFYNKIAIGVNNVWHRFECDYIVRKEATGALPVTKIGIPLIMSRHHCGVLDFKQNNFDAVGDVYYFEHVNNDLETVDLDVIGSDKIVVSFSTITSALHVAAYMGAENIILVGHDCGWLDGERNLPGYSQPLGGEDHYTKFLGRIEPQTQAVRERLQEVYGCRIYSLNPFLNFGLEGHRYERAG